MTAQLPAYILERRRQQDAPERTAPDLDLVEVGCRLTIGHAPRNDEEALAIEEREFDGDARVQTVYAIVSDTDPDTGEIRRAFMTVAWSKGRLHWVRIREDHVAKVHLPDGASLRWLIRQLGRELGNRKRGLTSDDIRTIEALHALGTSQASRA